MKKLTIKEASEVLGISEQAIRKRISRGTLNSVKENGHIFVVMDEKSENNSYKEEYELFFSFFMDELEKKDKEIEALKSLLKEKEKKIEELNGEVKSALKDNVKLAQGVHLEARKLIETFVPLFPEIGRTTGLKEKEEDDTVYKERPGKEKKKKKKKK
ncbi:helix-turn-helix domain-containing protein [Nitrosophilus alvini]|uniref:helix-turn-helix domain-containing protein n=1 Tax=Nitrosophilus alvini TaxID=2714855 RepID=UPI0019093173|nr:helix-turn-helix domain-containing protein [Nitrosophilus alvini]